MQRATLAVSMDTCHPSPMPGAGDRTADAWLRSLPNASSPQRASTRRRRRDVRGPDSCGGRGRIRIPRGMFRAVLPRNVSRWRALLSPGAHELRAVVELGLVLIMCAAAELDSLDRVRCAARPVVQVVELDKPGRRATPALVVDESASAPVALPHVPPHRRRDEARTLLRCVTRARLVGDGGLPRQQPLVQDVDAASDDHCRIGRAAWRHQILQLHELRVCLLVDRHADLVSARRQSHDHRWTGRRTRRGVCRHEPRFLRALGRRHDEEGRLHAGTDRLHGDKHWLLDHSARQHHHSRWAVRTRRDLRDQPLDRTPGLVSCSRQNLRVVLLGQVRRQQAHAGEMDLAARDHLEHEWKPPPCSCRPDSLCRCTLGHVEALDAEGEERAGGFAPVQFSLVDLREVRE